MTISILAWFWILRLASRQEPTGVYYYIDVGAFDDAGAGDYQLTVTAFQTPTAVWTNDQIAHQLVSGYWADGQHPFNVSSGGSLTVNIIGLNSAGQALARQALQTWKEITGINFIETTSATPQIMFTDDDPDGGAFTEGLTYNGHFVTSASSTSIVLAAGFRFDGRQLHIPGLSSRDRTCSRPWPRWQLQRNRNLSVRRALCERRLGDVGHVLFQPDRERLLQ